MAGTNYFKITTLEDNATIKTAGSGSRGNFVQLYYSFDNGANWTKLKTNIGQSLTVPTANTEVLWKNTAADWSTATNNYLRFQLTKKVKLSGSLMTLLGGTDDVKELVVPSFYMLFKCSTGIVDASELELPSTVLCDSCYAEMFSGCTSLEKPPRLPAAELKPDCYKEMFKGCSALEEVAVGCGSDQLNDTSTSDWLADVPETGTFTTTAASFDKNIERGPSTIPAGWTLITPPEYFRITNSAESGSQATVKFTVKGTTTTYDIKYRLQGDTVWNDAKNLSIGVAAGRYCEFKGVNQTLWKSFSDNVQISFSVSRNSNTHFELSGDLTTLLNETGGLTDLTGRDYCFRNLFKYTSTYGNMKIDNLLLPSAVLSKGCYQEMFYDCIGYMEHGEDGSAGGKIELPATQLVQDAYADMFTSSDIRYIKAGVPSSQLNTTYTNGWLDQVVSNGTFESTDPDFDTSIQRGATTIPAGWTIIVPIAGFFLNGKKVTDLYLNGKQVAELYINGKQVGYEAPEPPGPDPKLTNFRITNIGNATDYPNDTWRVQIQMPAECDMQVYHSDSGNDERLTPGQTTTLTLPYGEYLEFWGDNEHGLYPDSSFFKIDCPVQGKYEASGQLSSLAMQDIKEVGYSFYGLFSGNSGLKKADNLVLPEGYDGLTETFRQMFYGCDWLQQGPEDIPQANGTDQFADMFSGCERLRSVGVKWTTWPMSGSNVGTDNWLDFVNDTGVFTCPSGLEIPSRDENGVPEGWTIQNA